MNVYTRHLRVLESFNRASHSDSLREMQTDPTEEMIVGTGLGWVVPMGFLLVVALTVIGANA